jgi:hypothetical protein
MDISFPAQVSTTSKTYRRQSNNGFNQSAEHPVEIIENATPVLFPDGVKPTARSAGFGT